MIDLDLFLYLISDFSFFLAFDFLSLNLEVFRLIWHFSLNLFLIIFLFLIFAFTSLLLLGLQQLFHLFLGYLNSISFSDLLCLLPSFFSFVSHHISQLSNNLRSTMLFKCISIHIIVFFLRLCKLHISSSFRIFWSCEQNALYFSIICIVRLSHLYIYQ